MPRYNKKDFPVNNIRRFLEPGPIVLVSSRWSEKNNIMTMGWHMVMEYSPALIGCLISSANYSFEMIHKSEQCVINIPTIDLAQTTVRIGNCSGHDTDKFAAFNLTAVAADIVEAPLIEECFANLECVLADSQWVDKYNMFVFEVVKAHAPSSPKYPKTIHYRGEGSFMISGTETGKYRKLFEPQMLL